MSIFEDGTFEKAWEDREERIYPELFGPPVSDLILTPTFETFDSMGCKGIDPRWLTIGCRVYGPTPERPTFVHVSSGLSNDWDDEGHAGLGLEFMVESSDNPERASELVMRVAAYESLVASGQTKNKNPIGMGDTVPLRPVPGVVDTLFFWEPIRFPGEVETQFGKVELCQVLTITTAERKLMRKDGFEALFERLRTIPSFPCYDLSRGCTVDV